MWNCVHFAPFQIFLQPINLVPTFIYCTYYFILALGPWLWPVLCGWNKVSMIVFTVLNKSTVWHPRPPSLAFKFVRACRCRRRRRRQPIREARRSALPCPPGERPNGVGVIWAGEATSMGSLLASCPFASLPFPSPCAGLVRGHRAGTRPLCPWSGQADAPGRF